MAKRKRLKSDTGNKKAACPADTSEAATAGHAYGGGTAAERRPSSNPTKRQKRKAPPPKRGMKRIVFIVGTLAGLALSVGLQRLGWLGNLKMDMISQHLDETRSIVSDFMNKLNISVDMSDIDPRAMWSGAATNTSADTVAPGLRARKAGLKPKHPVVMIPGFVSTGLEIWEGEPCLRHYFRQRVWGTSSMVQALLADRQCWLRHMELDPETGLDPPGRKLRPAAGLTAADYVFQGYWVWGKVIENLAEIGYTSNDMYMASYDWRLLPTNMEKRDGYLTRLKATLETSLRITGVPAVIYSHSFGSTVAYFFMRWVESAHGGNAGPGWVDKHIAGFVNIAGTMLGVPKGVSAILSGEFKDTAQLGTMSMALDYYLSPERRARVIRSWGSMVTMLPRGGNAIWGTHDWAADDEQPALGAHGETVAEAPAAKPWCPTYGYMLSFEKDAVPPVSRNMTWEDALQELVLPRLDNPEYVADAEISSMAAADVEDLATNPDYDHPKYWTNPLTSTLPNAPNLKVWCLHGVNLSAERGYLYRTSPYASGEAADATDTAAADAAQAGRDIPSVPYTIFNSYGSDCFNSGLRMTNGDGTVPLMSLGYMCSEGWTNTKYPFNPARVPVTTVEYPHDPAAFTLRGGGSSGDHIDVLGNTELLDAVISIAAGRYDDVKPRVVSDIRRMSAAVDLHAHGRRTPHTRVTKRTPSPSGAATGAGCPPGDASCEGPETVGAGSGTNKDAAAALAAAATGEGSSEL